ncbi:restriction endonuclease [Kitasatospora sp. NPDC057940]|uniref:restriction endonuclease n=1 Tax=Kitasatospora sp. NPDC057940 TaxID=3346285 RepID=UPI0036DC475C
MTIARTSMLAAESVDDALDGVPPGATTGSSCEPAPDDTWGWPEVATVATAVLGGLALIAGIVVLGNWLDSIWWPSTTVLGPACFLFAVWGYRREGRQKWEERLRRTGLKYSLAQLDALHYRKFEYAVRDLMRRDGFRAERTGGGGDDACDVRAVDPDGRIWAVQVKHRRDGAAGKKIGVPVLQQVKGTAQPVHGATFALIVTNGGFSSKAIPWGKTHGIHLVDRHLLETWAAGGGLLWDLIDNLPAPKRHPSDRDHKKARRK